MTEQEIQQLSNSWAQDISTSRSETLAAMQKAESLARAKAGASGVKKGTAVWDNLIASARAPYEKMLKTIDDDELALNNSSFAPAKVTYATPDPLAGNDATGQAPEFGGPGIELDSQTGRTVGTIAREFTEGVLGTVTNAGMSSMGVNPAVAGPLGALATAPLREKMKAATTPGYKEWQDYSFGLSYTFEENVLSLAELLGFSYYTQPYRLARRLADTTDFEEVDQGTVDEVEGTNQAGNIAGGQSDQQSLEDEAQLGIDPTYEAGIGFDIGDETDADTSNTSPDSGYGDWGWENMGEEDGLGGDESADGASGGDVGGAQDSGDHY